MGKGRTSPKYLKGARQRRTAGANMALMSLYHGNPKGEHGYFITADHRVIDTSTIPDPVSKGRQKALNLSVTSGEFFSNISECAFIVVRGKHYPEGIKRFFSGTRFFFQTSELRSIVYSSKDLAMLVFNTGRITWVTRLEPPPQKLVFPRTLTKQSTINSS